MRSSPTRILSWAAFLGCSWTWCIGMFLPVLLVRDLGVWGWIVFATPNVIGAAAMGWVLTVDDSRRIIHEHRAACTAFSAVTIAFQLFFLAWWVGGRMISPAMIAGGAAATVFSLMLSGRDRRALAMSWLVLVVSLAMAAWVMAMDRTQPLPRIAIPSGRGAILGAAGLAPACILGFALCPYLDLTFHRARMALSPAASRAAFTIGFGVFFLAMIAFSLWYAPVLGTRLAGVALPATAAVMIGIHMTAQLALTAGLHANEAQALGQRWPTNAAIAVGLLAALAVILSGGRALGMDAGELAYRLFMGFYGLVFPAYVWIVMTHRGPVTRGRWIALGVAVALAIPFYAVGFLMGRFLWLPPAVLIVLLARWVPGRRMPAIAIACILIASIAAAARALSDPLLGRARREWKDQAIASIQARLADGRWLEDERLRLLAANASRPDGWVGGEMLVMENGDWIVCRNVCSKENRAIRDLFIGHGSDGRWYYSTFHFCVGHCVLNIELQPPSLATFVEGYYLRPFELGSDECLNATCNEIESVGR